jgi:hypothetical protein
MSTNHAIPESTCGAPSFLRFPLMALVALAYFPSLSFGQQAAVAAAPAESSAAASDVVQAAAQPVPLESTRIFGIFPNNRTWPSLTNYKSLSVRQKFAIARADSFDRGTIFLAAVFAVNAEHTNENPAFGQGIEGYSRAFAASYGDIIIGNYMTEAIYPALLHQDPRYFRRGVGSGWSRLGYAMGQIFWTHTDSGGTQFNYSEIVGNSTAVAISEAYYPDHRNAANAVGKLGIAVGVDMASNVLKEFWPDISRAFSKHRD